MTAPVVADAAEGWLWAELGLSVDVVAAGGRAEPGPDPEPEPEPDPGPDPGLGLHALVGLALRRNPRRAHLLVSRVLGKHLPVPPGEGLAAGARLAALVRTVLGSAADAADAADAAGVAGVGVHGAPTAADVRDPAPTDPPGPIVIGYCETATALGHAVADGLPESHYLHTTRRHLPDVVPILEFEESHSHAVQHLLVPEDPGLLRTPTPVVLVDDELSTGRTALGTVRALHAFAPRSHYVIAALVDARPAAARQACADLAAELGIRLDVVALISVTVTVPADVAERAARIRARFGEPAEPSEPGAASAAVGPVPAPGGAASAVHPVHPVQHLIADWPADLPDGGRHRWSPADRRRLDDVVAPVAATVRAALTRPAGRTLVLGTEELMYTPMRIADRLARTIPGEVRYQSTTRSPVYPVDVEGYAIRAALTFPAPDDPTRVSHVYNVLPGLYDDIVVVVDSGVDVTSPSPLADPAGMVAELRRCAAVTVLTLPSYRPADAEAPAADGSGAEDPAAGGRCEVAR